VFLSILLILLFCFTLYTGAVFSLSISSVLALAWPFARPDGIRVQGLSENVSVFFFTWIYCLFFWLVQDVFKVYTVKFLRKYNVGGVSASTAFALPESTLKMIKEMDEAEAHGVADHHHH